MHVAFLRSDDNGSPPQAFIAVADVAELHARATGGLYGVPKTTTAACLQKRGQGELAGAEETGCGGYSNSGRCVSSGSKNKPYHQLPHTVLSRHNSTGIWARHAAV
jgi:hypothetical protein